MPTKATLRYDKRRAALVAALNATLIIISIIYKLYASVNKETFACSVLEELGFPCPTCGGSRALFVLLELKPIKAFFYYPPIYYFISVVLYFDIKELIGFIKGLRPTYGATAKVLILLIPVTVIANFLLRIFLISAAGFDMTAFADTLRF